MKRTVTSLATTLSVAIVMLLGVAASVQAQNVGGKRCSNLTLSGTYGAVINGMSHGLPFAALDVVVADGKENFSGSGTVSYNGVVTRGVPLSATYAVNSDCSGSVTFSTGATQNLVVTADGNLVQFIRTDDPDAQVTGDARRASGICSAKQMRGHYAATLDGAVSGLPFKALDSVFADGLGNVSGSGTISYSGAITSSTFTATYAVNPDCSGTIAFSTGATQDLMIVSNGAEIRFIRTDYPDAVVTGIARNMAAPN
ncbi:MAG: hypothetical protein H0X25_04200 [Acidobacteriales bacterium]|nr:hypothetical protein [Terriglobales bacterium]